LQKLRYREFALRHELDQNRKNLEEANQKLVELDQIKSRFFANISHELRTPLTLLLAPLESLLARKDFAFDAQVREWLETMHANGMRLLKLINDLLDLVRLESGKMSARREPLAVDAFIHGLRVAVRKMADDKRVHLETHVADDVGVMMLDRDKLEKVVLNLLFNAIKFTPAGGRVDVRCVLESDNLMIRVTDTGMGISEKNLPHIFDRFWQADTSSQRKYQGVGIGLALVKELVEVQGGGVSVASELGKGTTMSIRLPCIRQDAALAAAEVAKDLSVNGTSAVASDPKTEEWLSGLYRRAELFPAMTSLQATLRRGDGGMPLGGPARPRLLIADDEPEMLRFLKSQLSERYEIIEAVDGHQAVELASQYLPDVILCDMMMPEKDGLQVCRELRAKMSTKSIPIVLLTARADDETKLSALSSGASDFLTKPFSSTEVHVRLANLVTANLAQRQVARQNQVLEATLEQLKETETQLVQTEKMASLGRMSAGIIHEINNPLNYAKTGLYALKSKGALLPESDRALFDEVVRDIDEGIDRVKNIVSDLRTFSHPNPGMQADVDITDVVTSALRFLSSEWKGKVDVVQEIPEGSAVHGNHNKLVQVLVNLLQNSLDAMRNKEFGAGKPAIKIRFEQGAGSSRLIVWDNGLGMSSEVQSKVFDPFFTTKDVGEGMGLGLSICYRILEEHGGSVKIRSEAGRFCEFTLEFPSKN
ncbi:MAG TPA: ATP-binding protein, partial [Roseimicrobium sp.]|nr:ATP-binding protein [Roseimicrobium sp.]